MKLFCSEKRNFLILCLTWAVCYLPVCWLRPLVMPDETRYAEIAREMVHGQSWIVPHLNGLLYFEKPVFGYWLNSLSLLLLGENAFAIRFPSALSVLITALAVYVLIRREHNEPGCAMTGSLLYLSTFGVWGIGVSAVLDNPFSLFCTLAIIAFYWATRAKRWNRQKWLFLALAGFSCGLGLQTKGFVVLAFIGMTAVPYLLIRKRYADLFRMAWLPAIMATLVTLPWGIMVHLQDHDFWRFFFWHEHVKRFFSSHAQHSRPFWYFLVFFPILFAPWSLFLPRTLVLWLKQYHRGDDGRNNLPLYCLCWFLGPLLFLSLSKGKLLTYILPCGVPLIIFITILLYDRLKEAKHGPEISKGWRAELWLMAVFLLLIGGAGLVATQISVKPGVPPLFDLKSGCLLLLAVLPALAGTGFLLRKGGLHPFREIHIITGGMMVFMTILPWVIPTSVWAAKAPGIVLRPFEKILRDPAVQILADSNVITACAWHLKRADIHPLQETGELEYGLNRAPASGYYLRLVQVPEFVKNHREKVAIVCVKRKHDDWWNLFRDQIRYRYYSQPEGIEIWFFFDPRPIISKRGAEQNPTSFPGR